MSRIKAYQQLEHSDCGLTCIRIIARYYGQVIPLKRLREICDVGRIGVSLRGIVDCLRSLGFRSEAVRISADDVERMPLPAILYWKQRHYVVLYKIDGRRRFSLADPAEGKIRLPYDEFCKCWMPSGDRGIAVVAEPMEDFYARRYEKEEGWGNGLWRLMKRAVKDNKIAFLIVACLTVLAMVADVVTPVLFQRTVDDGINGRDLPLVWLLVAGQFAVFLGNYASSSIADLLLTKIGLRMSIRMMNDYLGRLIRLPVAFFDRKVSSDFIQKLDDQNRIKNFLLSMPDTVFFTIVNLLVFSVMLVYYSPLVFGIYLIGTTLSLLWTQLHMRRRKTIDYASFSYASENRNNIYELVNGIQEIKVNGAQETRVAAWNAVQQKVNDLSMKAALLSLSVSSGNTFFSRMKDIVITGMCATMVVRGNLTIGEMITINYIAGRLAVPFANLVGLVGLLQDAAMSYERLSEIMDGGECREASEKTDATDFSICFDKVSFKYPGSYSPWVINDFSAMIEPGRTTAIVGASGCGKTTLIKLILGFYVPQKGRLVIGGCDVACVDSDEWMHRCGVVMQNGYIFSGTVLENIAIADAEPDEQRVREAASVACIDDFFSSLPMGYHTRLGNAGLELSGGQKQRLFIARAVYKNPSLLVLDEATSSLDANNESSIVRNLAGYNKGRTVVVAAHRLSTVRHADKIIYMDKGRILEEGTHDELVARHGAYYRLVKEQLDVQ